MRKKGTAGQIHHKTKNNPHSFRILRISNIMIKIKIPEATFVKAGLIFKLNLRKSFPIFYTLAIQTKKYNTMRKLMFALVALLGLSLGANAQDKSKKTPPPPPPKEAKAPLKKDGTPDKRFKENKETKAPLKKDGTPDKRFKENKEAKPKAPVKKDGTPDKRFKENKK
ncbi:MAG: hypothetical protein QM783_21220 [Phycisphaerales bacterium]